tara:strand:- start:794 stop:1903 length:1110 start_codon:yes stop_codon:yes gene_type:complete
MSKVSKNITFIFNHGRNRRINEEKEFPKEHFYGYFNFLQINKDTKLIENSEVENKFVLISKLLRKLTKFPIYIGKIVNKKNKKIIDNSNILFFSNQNLFYSAFPYIYINNSKNTRIVVFFMGYKNILKNKKKFNRIQKFFFTAVIKKIDNILFLSKSEKDLFSKEFPKFSKKANFINFAVDSKYWSRTNNSKTIDKILFLGNDESRDYKILINIVNRMPDKKFIIISNKINQNQFTSDNFNLIKSDWKTNKLRDSELKKIMENVDISIIPIKNGTSQPSGQSVTLQSMAMGIPVMINSFEGFWDNELLVHEKNIYLVKDNTVDNWIHEIKLLSSNKDLKNILSINGRKTIEDKLNLENFFNNLSKIINF